MKKIEVKFEPQDVERLDREAKQLNTNRSQLIRDRSLNPSAASAPVFDSQTYAKAVQQAIRTIPGIPRHQLEHCVATVINSLAT